MSAAKVPDETCQTPLLVDIDALRVYLPHTGAMCLLAGVRSFDQDSIECLATNHRHPAHPLRAAGRLGAACGVEYAAQAMAIHGALSQAGRVVPAPIGAIVGVRHVRFEVDRLDQIEQDLVVTCHRLAHDGGGAMYDFRILASDRVLLSGRVMVAWTKPSPPSRVEVS